MNDLPSVVATGIARWAERTPHRIAISDVRGSLTFAAVEQRVSACAAHVAASLGGGPRREAPGKSASTSWIPLLVDRSLDSALAVLTMVWAGQPFVPLDHATPPARLRDILDRIGSPRQVVVPRFEFVTEATAGLEHIVLADTAASPSDARLAPQLIDADAPGFIVLTSGSTGRPKAVVRRWNVFANRMSDQVEQWMCEPGEEWNAATLQPFTVSPGHRGLGAMALGRTMHIIDPATVSAATLVRWFNDRHINEATLSATLLRAIVESSDDDLRIPSLRLVRLTSESATWDLVQHIRRIGAPDVAAFTGYSATESGRAFHLEVRSTDPIGEGRLPLGLPLEPANLRLEPVAGDPSLTQLVVRTEETIGYLDDPDLQAARFRTDEQLGLAPRPDVGLWWSSGDIAVVDDSGLYHHRGRIDDMVKINGMLVEPSESERALSAIPGINAVAVIPQKRANGKWRLVAHLATSDSTLTPESVLTQLHAQLPDHLIPAVLVRHDVLPFSERNKLDRAALRSTPIERWASGAPAPIYDETTRWVAARVGVIADVGAVRADEDIWDLGMDSLAAVELCAAISDAGLGELEPTALLTARTAAQIAEALRTGGRNASPVVVINANGERAPLFIVPGGGGSALAFRSLARELGPEQPLVIVEPRGLHQDRMPDHSIPTMAGRLVTEVTARIQSGRQVRLLGYSSGATIAFEAAHQLLALGFDPQLAFLDATVRGRNVPVDPIRTTRSNAPVATVSIAQRRDGRSLAQLARQAPAIARRFAHRVLPRVRTQIDDRIVYRPWRPLAIDPRHYDRFGLLIGRACRRYTVERLPAPITVIESEAVGRGDRTRPYATSVSVLRCGGDHFTVLEPPHVRELADLLRPFLDGSYPNG